MKKLALLFITLCLAGSSGAYSFKSGSIFYNITSSTSPYTVEVTDSTTSNGGSYFGAVSIPSTVTYGGTTYAVTAIGYEAFDQCINLSSVNIPTSITSIGYYSFSYCTKLTSITIPASVTSFDDGVFEGCTGLTSINIPVSVITLGKGDFWYCSNLTSITVDASNTNFVNVDGVLFNKNKTTLICYPAGNTASTYSIPSTVLAIDSDAFGDCTNLTSITIPSSVISIGSNALYACRGLTSISIPSSVTYIGDNAFGYCIKLASISAYPTKPVSLTSKYVFDNVDTTTCVLHVPSASLSTYQTANVWKSFKHIVGDLSSGIANTTALAVKITVANGELQLVGVPSGETLGVYNAVGASIYTGKTTGSALSISLPAHGVYIVQLGNASRKVIY
ncbi:MAG: leucine-rich repeat domain-containing protein [Paludibacteraceae bacterium]|nr:leucine-rich repeat domain-containing protein [Paludibacteraceae bacterium]